MKPNLGYDTSTVDAAELLGDELRWPVVRSSPGPMNHNAAIFHQETRGFAMESGSTRNRWNWQRIAIIYGCVFGVAACAPRHVQKYYGVRLGTSMKEVSRIVGNPTIVLGVAHRVTHGGLSEVMRTMIDVGEIPTGKTIDEYPEWVWEKNGRNLVIAFDKANGKVVKVRCTAGPKSPTTCKPFLGVMIGTTEQSLKKKLGPPSHQSLDKTTFAATKTFTYDKLNAIFVLEKQKVSAIEYKYTGKTHP